MKTIKFLLGLLIISLIFCHCEKNNDDDEPCDPGDSCIMAKSDKEISGIMKYEAEYE